MMKKKKVEINPETVLRRDPEQDFTYIDGEVVMLSLKNGEYYGLDKVGSRIWELVECEIKYSDLLFHLMNEFEVDEQTCNYDTKDYLQLLKEKGLLTY